MHACDGVMRADRGMLTEAITEFGPHRSSSGLEPLASLKPVSATLDTELRRVVKERGLVVWLDADSNYSSFVRALSERASKGEFPFPVLAFEGSFLELLLKLEPYANGLYPEKVLVYLPGFNKGTVSTTPLYELYCAGRCYEIALDTLIEQASVGVVRPAESVEYRKRRPTLDEADSWLAAAKAADKDVFLLWLEGSAPSSVLGELFSSQSTLLSELADATKSAQFVEYLERRVGLPSSVWLDLLQFAPDNLKAEQLRTVVATWLMAVEFATDLREEPVAPELRAIRTLPKIAVKECHELVEQLRQRWPETYQQLSGEFEGALARDEAHAADKLGSLDTFRFEERAVRKAAVQALVDGDFEVALNFSRDRAPEKCFWVRLDKGLERTWRLVQAGAAVGRTISQSRAGLKGCNSLEEATQRYRDSLFKVDQQHRQFEQMFHHQHSMNLEDGVVLVDARRTLQRVYRDWANMLTEQFCKLCEDYGPLPSADLRQRGIYEHRIHPLIERGVRVAVFMVDALRFEMAEELRRFFEGRKYDARLEARLAELPTVTEVGMNALSGVSRQGRLRLVRNEWDLQGFRSGDAFTVAKPEHRVKAMAERSVGGEAIDVWLADLIEKTPDELRNLLRRRNSSRLIVVRSLELDAAGEKGFHLGTFEQTLFQLREAIQKLQAAGIAHFVLVADHGFLLQDQTAEQISYKDARKQRYVWSAAPSGMSGALDIPLSALDYDGDNQGYFVFRRDTAVWRTEEKLAPFVHGGNSLQERVVPVLMLEKQGKAGSSAARYEVIARALDAEGIRRQRLSIQVRLQRRATGELSFAGPRKISLALRVVGHNILPEVVEVTPPGSLDGGTIYVPPGAEEATVTFGIEGEIDEKVRVEVYHPDGAEQVEPATVSGWFEMYRNRRTRKAGSGEYSAVVPDAPPPAARLEEVAIDVVATDAVEKAPPPNATPLPPSARTQAAALDWRDGFGPDDAEYVIAFARVERNETVNEVELAKLFGSPRKVRFFARRFDELKKKVPFEVNIQVINGMKTYVKGGQR